MMRLGGYAWRSMNLGPIETDDQYADAAEFIETVRETVLVDWRGQHARGVAFQACSIDHSDISPL
jgi:hypothetical protein